MTMMTSLKALLFPTAAAPAGAGAGVMPVAVDGAQDFAALLGGVTGDTAPALPTAAPDQASPAALPDVATVPTAAILTAKVGIVPPIVPAESAPEPTAQDGTTAVSAEAATPHIKPDITAATPHPVVMDEPEAAAATDEEAEGAGEQTDDKSDEPGEVLPTAAVLAPSMPVVAPPVMVAAQTPTPEAAPSLAPSAPARAATLPTSVQVASAVPEQAAPRQTEPTAAIEPDMPSGKIVPQMPVTSAEPAPKSQQAEPATANMAAMPDGKNLPQLPAAPAVQSLKTQPLAAGIVQASPDIMPATAQPIKTTPPPSDMAVGQLANEAMQADLGKVVPLPAAQQVAPSNPTPSAAQVAVQALPLADPMIAASPLADATDSPIVIDAAQSQPKATHAAPPRAEAVSLLQFVRDHLNARAPAREAVPVAKATAETPTAQTLDTSAAASAPAPILSTAAPTQLAAAPTITMPAAPDLSASLGAQVVDMGVQGQWIDGLARDIAGLSANGAQGRFQIDTQQLGPVQVAIRQDGDGAAVSLTVATKAAEDALRQDSDRLRLDAGLQAIRISEVKIERAPHVAEAARSDTQNQQQPSQQNGQQGQQSGWQASGQHLGQNANQSAQQGRWQGRENFSGPHKAGADASVLNQADAGESTRDGPRARYA